MARAAPPAVVLLDAAGTLIRPARPVGETYAAVAARHGAELGSDALGDAFRAVFPRMPPMAFPEVLPDELDLLERGWWRRLVRDVLAACGAEVDDFDACFAELYEGFASPEAWRPYPEVARALERLRDAGSRLAVVSNFDSRLVGILDGLDLADHLETVVFSTRAGAAKPDAAIFGQALAALDAAPAEAVHVGDSRRADLDGASAAGIAAWLLVRGRTPEGPAEIVDLDAFADRVLGA